MTFEAHEEGLVGTVAAAGQCQRAEHLRAHAGDVAEAAGFGQVVFDEPSRGTHRPDRVRGTRPDADLVEVEGGDGHADAIPAERPLF